MSTHSSSNCFLTKVTQRNEQSRTNKSKKGAIPPQGAWEKNRNCVSMSMHIGILKVILSILTENYISFFRYVCSAVL